MERRLPDLDIPENFVTGLVGEDFPESVLGLYRYPCRLKAGIFAFCVEGTMDATINLNRYRIGKNAFITLSPGSVIQFHGSEGRLRVYFVGFSSEFMVNVSLIRSVSDFFPMVIEEPVLSLSEPVADLYTDYYRLLRKSFLLQHTRNPELLKCVLNSFVLGISEMYREYEGSGKTLTRGEELCKKFVQLAMKHYVSERNITFYAEKLRITPQHLSATVKKVTRKNATEIIARIVVMDAKAQLKSTDLTIQEISYSLNFPNVSFFGKYFKRHVGMSPNEYRKS
ncbi:helix-turn-helix domain-containing protein [Gallalistipes aquisgranensis]|uniref:helix-turn-helix domain-containing protein n=1 Tax=Gallalistipes aquisgranensis TaxID=2779358 RepID=UPI001CF8E6FC|nr:helix-turn-helix domain-containing protein [Gallalistipes aquisgranensis]MBE5032438.1 AraC family transcriptional regulator [Gallalistipes aquisgranensis]